MNNQLPPNLDGQIESAADTAEVRVREHAPWLSRLPTDFTTILDIGAGAGYHSKYFLEQGKQPVALERYADAFRFSGAIRLIPKDLLDFDTSETFDAIFCSHVLEHFADPAVAVRKMRSLLKPNGYLFIIVPPYVPLVANYHWHPGWNCAQLAMFLAALGFDCSEATFMEFTDIAGHVCGWGRKRDVVETKFNLRRSLPLLPPGMSEMFFTKDGYEFLPGHLSFADPAKGQLIGDAERFEVPDFQLGHTHTLVFREHGWLSAEVRCSASPIDLSKHFCTLFIAVGRTEMAPSLRVAVGHSTTQDIWQNCSEYYLNLRPGLNCFRLRSGDFRQLRGEVDFSRVESLSIGGLGERTTIHVWCYFPDGRSAFN